MSRSLIQIAGAAAVANKFRQIADKYTTSDKWVVESGATYSIYVELGTSTQAAQPYMRPAIQAVKPRAGAIVAKHGMDKGLEIIAKEIKREAKQRAPVRTGNLKAKITAGKV